MTTGTWIFYMLRCKDNSLYSGITNNLDERLKTHNQGKGARYTASHRPVILVHSERFSSDSDAMKREREVKRWPKLKKENLVKGALQTPDFSAELMAPCGMNCALCSAYQAYANRMKPRQVKMTQCIGCRPRGKQCAYIKRVCENLREGKITYCYECAIFPCNHLKHLDERYRRDYSYSMIETLHDIKSRGTSSPPIPER